ncbi:MAG: hypothetical protein HQL74_14000 [Magnetococcales bacterium]|nr:hypothetical protein [Magnetococcales bacterium]
MKNNSSRHGCQRMIPITNCEDFKLEQAWKKFKRTDRLQGLPPESANLLLFYAVECGLKHLLLAKLASPKCPVSGKGLLYSHNLKAIASDLWSSSANVPRLPRNMHLKLKSGKKECIEVEDVHLAWRYGLSIDETDEKKMVEWLRKINDYMTKMGKTL